MFVIEFGNTVWWFVMLATALITAAICLILRRKPMALRKKGLLSICIFTAVMFYVHRFFLFQDSGYLAKYGDIPSEKLICLLPLHLCYLSLIFLIIGLLKNNAGLLSFCFYCSSCGAIFAIIAPEDIFCGVSIFNPSVLLFYLLHGLLLSLYFSVGFLGIIKPSLSLLPRVMLILLVTGVIIHGINYIGHLCGIENMNYFYTMKPSGSSLLVFLWKLLPVSLFYILGFAYLALAIYSVLLTIPFRIREKMISK